MGDAVHPESRFKSMHHVCRRKFTKVFFGGSCDHRDIGEKWLHKSIFDFGFNLKLSAQIMHIKNKPTSIDTRVKILLS